MSSKPKKPDTRGLIIQAAADEFHARGYERTTMDDIARAAGTSKGTLYYHFASKNELLATIHEVFMDVLEVDLRRHDDIADPCAKVNATIQSILTLMATHRTYVRVFFEHHRELDSSTKVRIRARRNAFEQQLVLALEQGQRHGLLRDHSARVMALAIFGMCNWSYQWFRGDEQEAALIAAELTDVVFEGIKLPSAVPSLLDGGGGE